MNVMRLVAAVGAALLLALPATTPHAQTDDVFAFIPDGGRTLLTDVLRSGAPAAEVTALLTGDRTRAEWLAYLQERSGTIPALVGLTDRELVTLADYLDYNMPLPAKQVPADPARANWAKVLPQDGRDLTLNHCQFCHIITVVVTQDKSQEAWLGTMHKPSHIEIELTEHQREALASYLVLNAHIPVDDVPEELRAGGASY